MIKYNATYDRWVTDDGKVYRQDNTGAFILCKQSISSNGYLVIRLAKPFRHTKKVHRLVWETFKGPIPDGMVIDHDDTHKDNNTLSNLKVCTQKDNNNNPLTKINKRKPHKESDFGKKYFEHFGYSRYEDSKQYNREQKWYREHNKTCRWE